MQHRLAGWLCAAGAGAGAMFLLDPARGRRRRAEAGRRTLRATHTLAHAARVTSRDVGHRTAGFAARVRSAMRSAEEPIDQVLVARVRSALGRSVSHPGAVGVLAHDGTVTLDGPVLTTEEPHVLSALAHVRGVRRIENHLTLHDAAGVIPGLQGSGIVPRLRPAYAPSIWSPTARLVAAASGMALAAWGARRSRPVALAAVAAGAAILAGGLLTTQMRRARDAAARREMRAASGETVASSHNAASSGPRLPSENRTARSNRTKETQR